MGISVVDGVPVDSQGRPAIKIMASTEEKVGIPGTYSSVTVGPVSISRFIEEGDEEHIEAEIKKSLHLLERLVATEREFVLQSIQENASKK